MYLDFNEEKTDKEKIVYFVEENDSVSRRYIENELGISKSSLTSERNLHYRHA